MVSRLFGKLEARRHLISGWLCAMAGAATVEAASPMPAVFKKERLLSVMASPEVAAVVVVLTA
jgi:hypothetical protein